MKSCGRRDRVIGWFRLHPPRRPAALLRGSAPAHQNRLKFYLRPTAREAGSPITADVFTASRLARRILDRSKETFSIDLQGGTRSQRTRRDVPSLPGFFADQDEDGLSGSIRLVLPGLRGGDRSAAQVRCHCRRRCTFTQATPGYALNFDHLGDLAYDADVPRGSWRGGFRHRPSGACHDADGAAGRMKRSTGSRRIGDGVLKDKETDASDPRRQGLEVHKPPHGLAVVAGDKPLLGDVNRKEDLRPIAASGRS